MRMKELLWPMKRGVVVRAKVARVVIIVGAGGTVVDFSKG